MASAPVAEFTGVGKTYPAGRLGRARHQALNDVTFQIPPGEVFGLVGPNRAGKTTLVKILLGLCRPTDGQASRLGRPVSDRGTLARVGFLHEHQALPRYWHAAGLLEYYGALTGLPEPEVRRRVPGLLERVGLADRSREPIARFSKGMVQRLGLAQALLNNPDLLVLDEPTEGLDFDGRLLVHEMVRERRARGAAVFLVSHSLADLEALCDRVGVLYEGQLIHEGPVRALCPNRANGASWSLADALQELYRACPS